MGRPREFDRDDVLARALDVFWAKGYEATSLDDLTGAMGVGRGSLYNEFNDKHSLFIAALDRYRADRLAQLTAILQGASTARAGIAAALRGTAMALWADEQRRGCLMVNSTTELAASDPAVAARARESFENTARAFRSALKQGQQSGELAGDLDVRATSRFLASTLNSLRLLAKMTDRAVANDVVEVSLMALD
jgi:TetR/AcrR family transcriptional regulator, transcriptional repressor for nem operon